MKKPREWLSKCYKRETIEFMRNQSYHGLDGATILDLVPLPPREWWVTFWRIGGLRKVEIEKYSKKVDPQGKGLRRQEIEETLTRAKRKIEAYRANPDQYPYKDLWLRHEAMEAHDRLGRLLFDDREQDFLKMASDRLCPEEIGKRLDLTRGVLDALVERVREKHRQAWGDYLERVREWREFTGYGTCPAMLAEVFEEESENSVGAFDPEMSGATTRTYRRRRDNRHERRSPAELDRMQERDAHPEESRSAEVYDLAIARILEGKRTLDDEDRQALEEIAREHMTARR